MLARALRVSAGIMTSERRARIKRKRGILLMFCSQVPFLIWFLSLTDFSAEAYELEPRTGFEPVAFASLRSLPRQRSWLFLVSTRLSHRGNAVVAAALNMLYELLETALQTLSAIEGC